MYNNYKDKRFFNFFKMELNFILMKSFHRRLILGLCALFLVFYFYILLKSNDNHIIINDVIEPIQKASDNVNSKILETLMKSQESLDNLPIHTLVSPYKNGMFIYNMEELTESWWTFECIETKMKNSINTQLCIHEPKYDNHISGQLKDNGLWEPTNVRSFIKQLEEVPDCNVIDIGANIGLYTLIAAKMGRMVIAVEPIHDNLNRIHKAAHHEKVQSRIIALVNAVSNQQGEVQVSIIDFNIGGAYIKQPELQNLSQEITKFEQVSSSVIVNSITMNDLYDVYMDKIIYLNKTASSKKFIIKLDIEGYEPYAFEMARKLFERLEIVAVFLEFGKLLENLTKLEFHARSNYLRRTRSMLRMLEDFDYEPYEPNGINKLEYKEWQSWPWDVYFRKCDLVNCPGHVYKAVGV